MQIRWDKRWFCFYVLAAKLFSSETSTFAVMERKTILIELTKTFHYKSSTFEEKSQMMVVAPLDAQAKPLIAHGWKFAERQTQGGKRIWRSSDANQTENLAESCIQLWGNKGYVFKCILEENGEISTVILLIRDR